MGITFVVNPGSTSRKYAWFRNGQRILSVAVEATPAGIATLVTDAAGSTTQNSTAPATLTAALPFALDIAATHQVYQHRTECTLAALRVVAPSAALAKHQWYSEAAAAELARVAPLVPLHIPIIQAELAALQAALPDARIALVSDSAFHTTLDTRVSATGLAYSDAEAAGVRRFGYHGVSVASVSRQLKDRSTVFPARTIVCHLGGGVSVTALREGASIATSMGLTPASGIAMGTRGGDIAADELAAALTAKQVTLETMWEYLYVESGWYGQVGVSDLRALIDAASDPYSHAAAVLARFVYQVQSYIAAYTVLLGGLDTIVLTGTAAVRNSHLRERLLHDLSPLGVQLHRDANDSLRGNGVISTPASSVLVEVMANDEGGEMARVANALTD